MRVKINVDFTGSAHVVLKKEEALSLLNKVSEYIGDSRNLSESLRIIRNFDEYYRLSRKKFEEYLFPPKDPAESLRGLVVIQKIRLMKNKEDLVELVFDRRVETNLLVEALKKIGFDEIIVEKQSF